MQDAEGKLQEVLQKEINDSKKEEVNINSKRIECMVVSKKVQYKMKLTE